MTALTLLVCGGCDRPAESHSSAAAQHDQSQPQQAAPPPELTLEQAARIPPYPLTKVTVHTDVTAATIKWEPSPLENIVKYHVYRTEPGEKQRKIGETSDVKFVDGSPKLGAEYGVAAVNVYGAESPAATAKAIPDRN